VKLKEAKRSAPHVGEAAARRRLEAECVSDDDAMPAVNERLRRDDERDDDADDVDRASAAARDMESDDDEVSEGGADDGVRTLARAAAAAL